MVCVAWMVLNRTLCHRMIPKQECCVILGGMDLTFCTERIKTVSISGYNKIRKGKSSDFVSQYSRRKKEFHDLSLYQYFQKVEHERNESITCIPHFVGGSGQPTYPVTQNYARTVLLIHSPWNEKDRPNPHQNWVSVFNEFIETSTCPQSVKIAYERG